MPSEAEKRSAKRRGEERQRGGDAGGVPLRREDGPLDVHSAARRSGRDAALHRSKKIEASQSLKGRGSCGDCGSRSVSQPWVPAFAGKAEKEARLFVPAALPASGSSSPSQSFSPEQNPRGGGRSASANRVVRIRRPRERPPRRLMASAPHPGGHRPALFGREMPEPVQPDPDGQAPRHPARMSCFSSVSPATRQPPRGATGGIPRAAQIRASAGTGRPGRPTSRRWPTHPWPRPRASAAGRNAG